jgi:hypothetical protein
MTKKILVVLVAAAFIAGEVFAQSEGKKMTLSLDAAKLFEGFIAGEDTDASERSYFALSPVFEYAMENYSIGARVDVVFGEADKMSVTHFGLAAIGRWYPLTPLEKLYLGAELGFDTCSMEDVDDALYTGLTLALRAGWKHNMGPIFLEPSLGYVLSKTDGSGTMPLTPSGWEIGLGVGLAF